MEKSYKNKYGIWSGIALVVSATLGCGIFIKIGDVLKVSEGSLQLSLLAWLVGGIIMIVSAFCFAVYASRIVKFGGLIDYVENSSNKTIGYYLAYYLGAIYYPLFSSQIAIIASQYVLRCFTDDANIYINSYITILFAFSLITIFFVLNLFAPKIANYFQISVLFVKLAPLLLIILVGLFSSFIAGAPGIVRAFIEPATDVADKVSSFGEAIKITSFAYDGWICVTSLNAEMKNSKKNLPKVIIIGTAVIVILYLIFFIGFSSILGNKAIIENGPLAGCIAFMKIFNSAGSIIFLLFLSLSCIGTFSANYFCASRSLIALGYRNLGFMPKRMIKTNSNGDFTFVPYIFSYMFCLLFLVIWYLANRQDIPYFNYLKDMDTISCALLYLPFILMYIKIMRSFKNENVIIRFIMPALATIGGIFFIFCGTGIYQLIVNKDLKPFLSFLIYISLCAVMMLPALAMKRQKN